MPNLKINYTYLFRPISDSIRLSCLNAVDDIANVFFITVLFLNSVKFVRNLTLSEVMFY
jgi:hypothetical protein